MSAQPKRTRDDRADPLPRGASAETAPFSRLLIAWQETADERRLEKLLLATGPVVRSIARQVLRAADIADLTAVDDALVLVFDHLRRLPGVSGGERAVEQFHTNHARGPDDRHATHALPSDPGLAFVRWLATERTRDVVRARKRQSRHVVSFRTPDHLTLVDDKFPAPSHALDEAVVADSLRLAITKLDERSRKVLEMLLEGHSQAEISRMLGVCAGTVSRIRFRAIEEVRERLKERLARGKPR